MIVAFDVDGTLIDFNDNHRKHVVSLVKWFVASGAEVIIWSGGGKGYAEMVGVRVGLPDDGIVYMSKFPKPSFDVDIAFDDEADTLLANQMFIVGRYKNDN